MPMIHNRGKVTGSKTVARKIIYPKAWDDNGHVVCEGKKPAMEVLLPGEHKNVTQEQYLHLKANCENEIVNLDDIKDMQAQFKAAEAPKPREGYVAPEDVEARVAKRVKEEMAKQGQDAEDAKQPGEKTESREELARRIDAMDRSSLIALIEKEGLPIEHKNYKAPAALKSAVLAAMEAA